MRLLYTVPLSATIDGPTFEITLAFAPGPRTTPSQFPVIFRRETSDSTRYIMEYDNQGVTVRKTVQFDANYLLPSSAFIVPTPSYYWARPTAASMYIRPDTSHWTSAYTTTVETSTKAGIYTAVYAAMPDSVALAVSHMESYTLETSITAGGKTFLSDAPSQGCFAIYCKSQSLWNGMVRWTAYAGDGSIGYTYNQRIEPSVITETSSLLPLIWGAKYTLKEGLGSLGGLFGFVDGAMSLLALEADSIPAAQAAQWSDSGVPPLETSEIVFTTAARPTPPQENIIYEYTPVVAARDATLAVLKVQVSAKGLMSIRFGAALSGSARIAFYDLSGRMVSQWFEVQVNGGSAQMMVPGGLHGTFVMHVSVRGATVKQKVILP